MVRANKPVAIITGVSGGIGQATAKLFSAKGWIVVGTVRGRTGASELRGAQIDLQQADMIRPRDLERVVLNAWRTYGRIDALICNAGYGLIGPLESLDYARMTDQFAVNTLGPAELIRQVLPLMRIQKTGVIVGVSSLVGRTGIAGYSVYAASKFALEGLFESLAMELGATGIKMKLVEPSGVNTPFWKESEKRNPHNVNLGHSHRSLSAERVAEEILRAVGDKSSRLRYPLGQTFWINVLKRAVPERLALRLLSRVISGR